MAGKKIAIPVVHEDAECIVINKPAGLVTHPGAGHREDTLANGLLFQYPELARIPRAGIVHRLDKDTAGLLVVARTRSAHKMLAEALQDRLVSRKYLALVKGRLLQDVAISAPIGRHPVWRQRMAVRSDGKPAVTRVRPVKYYGKYSLIEAVLDTGRTHQIRVHMAYRGYPLIGDPVYGTASRVVKTFFTGPDNVSVKAFSRQALHATELGFRHPVSGIRLNFKSELPQDFATLLQTLEEASEEADTPQNPAT